MKACTVEYEPLEMMDTSEYDSKYHMLMNTRDMMREFSTIKSNA